MVILGDAQLAGGRTYDFAASGRTMAMIAPNETLAATERAAISPTACRAASAWEKKRYKKDFFSEFTGG